MPRKNDWLKITIITPSFNQGQYLEQAIKSVVGQDYPNLEYLILDGGSTDNSVEIIKKYASRYPKVIKWRSHKDRGQVVAINEGLAKGTGEIVAYLNSDDYYLPGTLLRVANEFRQFPKRVWLVGFCRAVGQTDGVRSWVRRYTNFWLSRYSYQVLQVLNCISQPATFWKRAAAERVGRFDSKYKMAFDYDYWLRMGLVSDPIVLKQPLAAFRVHPRSKGKVFWRRQFIEEYNIAAKYTTDKFVLWLHKLHHRFLVFPIYGLS